MHLKGQRLNRQGIFYPKMTIYGSVFPGSAWRHAGAAAVMVQGVQAIPQEALSSYTQYWFFFQAWKIQEWAGVSKAFTKVPESKGGQEAMCSKVGCPLPQESLGDNFIKLGKWSLSWNRDSSISGMPETWDIYQVKLESQSGADLLYPG